ncbi:palmitoyltransferase Erf2p [[Candida] anglica]|uniref:Palmitoyltransferase n=1 Tax=[Candida] anglica TaxID=148631 RepID=A0ABP0EL97_9ASCO
MPEPTPIDVNSMSQTDQIDNPEVLSPVIEHVEQDNSASPPLIHRFIYNWLITDPGLNYTTKKNYQVQKHEDMRTLYFCGGRLRTVKQRPLNLITGVLIVLPAVLFWVYEAQWVWENVSPAPVIIFTYLWCVTLALFFKASTCDPGVLPRNIHLPLNVDPVTHSFIAKVVPEEYSNSISLPHKSKDTTSQVVPTFTKNRETSSNSPGVLVKYCGTCHIWRPPRASHCTVCNVCVVNHDHHCVFLNNCVGIRNYRYFLWFLACSSLTSILLSALSFIQVVHYKFMNDPLLDDFGDSIYKYPVGFFLALYGTVSLVYPTLLWGLHLCLTGWNLTTREYLNNVWGRKHSNFVNVFDTQSLIKNLYINWISKPNGITLMRMTDPYDPGDLRMEKVAPLSAFPTM